MESAVQCVVLRLDVRVSFVHSLLGAFDVVRVLHSSLIAQASQLDELGRQTPLLSTDAINPSVGRSFGRSVFGRSVGRSSSQSHRMRRRLHMRCSCVRFVPAAVWRLIFAARG
eukprot:TRINITY_DN3914_c0_g1_i1.p4 TRINITY_DN3914_c0_g1~~TRINITY_DN3914_c0_g1_i1.p4  ORF type:complete len:113 (-),score=4.06 TRINITY_DN3914_c0_g1_i1:263-601(-)